MEQPEDVEQPKDVEQAQRGGTGPKRWNRGKMSNILHLLWKKTGVTLDVEQPQFVEQPHTVEQPQFVEQAQRCGTGQKMWNKGKTSNTGMLVNAGAQSSTTPLA